MKVKGIFYRWNLPEKQGRNLLDLAKQLDVSVTLTELLLKRGYHTKEAALEFLYPNLSTLPDPYSMKDMEPAIERILRAIKQKERILIHGDYDVDGITGTALLYKLFKPLGVDVHCYLPCRFQDGFGLSRRGIEYAHRLGCSLIISVDCGITDFEEATLASELGMDLIITDHHQPRGDELPQALAVVNPNRIDCPYTDKNISGSVVAFKIYQALKKRINPPLAMHSALSLSCIGAIADVSLLIGENRIISFFGLRALSNIFNPGLKALCSLAGINDRPITATDVGFIIAPRLNVMGRLEHANKSLQLLLEEDPQKVMQLAITLNRENSRRQRIQEKIFKEAMEMAQRHPMCQDNILVLAREGWHQGVIGIVASKVKEQLNKPTILIALEGDQGRASGRSIAGFNLVKAIAPLADLFEGWGGHEGAIGFSIHKDKIEELRIRLNQLNKHLFTSDLRIPYLDIDAQIDANKLKKRLLLEINQCEPFGAGNPQPVFYSRNLVLTVAPSLLKDKHIKLNVRPHNSGASFDALWWSVGDIRSKLPKPGEKFSMAYSPEFNTFRGIERIQFIIKDIARC